MQRPQREDGSAGEGVALLILIAILSLVMYSLFIAPSYASGQTARAGMNRVTDSVVADGDVTGYADRSGVLGPALVENAHPLPTALGAVQVPLRLASVRLSWQAGTGADLGNATVAFTGPAGTETLRRSQDPVLRKPAWSIVQKGSTLPGQDANGNDLLEPNERFVLFVYPSHPLPPESPFSVRITIPGENPIVISRSVPAIVGPVMDLG